MNQTPIESILDLLQNVFAMPEYARVRDIENFYTEVKASPDAAVAAFGGFLRANDATILSRKLPLPMPVVELGAAAIDMNELFSALGPDVEDTLWKYVLKMHAIVTPSPRAREVLRAMASQVVRSNADAAVGGDLGGLVGRIFENLEEKIQTYNTDDPGTIVKKMAQDGTIEMLVDDIQAQINKGIDVDAMMKGMLASGFGPGATR